MIALSYPLPLILIEVYENCTKSAPVFCASGNRDFSCITIRLYKYERLFEVISLLPSLPNAILGALSQSKAKTLPSRKKMCACRAYAGPPSGHVIVVHVTLRHRNDVIRKRYSCTFGLLFVDFRLLAFAQVSHFRAVAVSYPPITMAENREVQTFEDDSPFASYSISSHQPLMYAVRNGIGVGQRFWFILTCITLRLRDADECGRVPCPVCNKPRKFYCYTCLVPVGDGPSSLPRLQLPLHVDM